MLFSSNCGYFIRIVNKIFYSSPRWKAETKTGCNLCAIFLKRDSQNGKLIYVSRNGGVLLIKKLWRFMTTPEMLLYIAFGVMTTLINIGAFQLANGPFGWTWQAANIFCMGSRGHLCLFYKQAVCVPKQEFQISHPVEGIRRIYRRAAAFAGC